ncbi:MAG: FecR domain-containing protein [Oligoflexia bacterium]|nr:FecR domain-containing protein [Oligoflexia bacterium]
MSKRYCALVLLLTSIFALTVFAEEAEVAVLDAAEGNVEASFYPQKEFSAVQVGQIFHAMDTIKLGRNSKASVLFKSGVLLRLAPGTVLQFESSDGTRPIRLETGKGYFFNRDKAELPEIYTPAVTTAIRGTEFVLEVQGQETTATVLDGQVAMHNPHGSLLLARGEAGTARVGAAPVKAVVINPRDAVQWALYYPLLGGGIGGSQSSRLAEASRQLHSGESAQAEALLSGISLESLGAEEQARVLAQRSVIALARNDSSLAESFAKQALAKSEQAPEAKLAASYLAQSKFDLDQASELAGAAWELAPQDPVVAARVAELSLARGQVAQAEKALDQASARGLRGAQLSSVRGFLELIKGHRETAAALFKDAIVSDSGFAAPHLGLGLTIVNQGDLAGGRLEIQKAAALDPNVAIYRSYLGKAFFEEEREGQALNEYELAIALDPRDPTPFLYRAYSNLSANDPISALEDVEHSIDLNSNRAVYRSSFLLDQDLGVRGASLAEVFNTLGFSQAARIEAIKSINRDYSNYSAHRLLSESYQSIITNDAQVSEQQISDLLAPLSFNLFRQGSSSAGLNEYSALFERNETRTGLGFEGVSYDDIAAPSFVTAGKFDDLGYYVGGDAQYQDGSKHNDLSYQYRLRGSAQYQLSYRDRALLNADAIFAHTLDHNSDINDDDLDSYGFDGGYNHKFSPNLTFVLQSGFDNRRNSLGSSETSRLVQIIDIAEGQSQSFDDELLVNEFTRERVKSSRSTAQVIYDNDSLAAVIGAQIYYADVERDETSNVLDDSALVFPGLDYQLRSRGYTNLSSSDLYGYSIVKIAPWLDLNPGLTLTQVDLEGREITPFISEEFSRTRLNPKVGVTLYPIADLTVRAAYFEGLRKTSLEDNVSLEPSLVGGINQLFTDFPGNRTRNYGAGVDYKLTSSTYVGMEALHRHIIDQIRPADTSITFNFDALDASQSVDLLDAQPLHYEADFLNAYWYQVLCRSVVLAVEGGWSDFERTDPELAQDIEAGRVGASLRYFHSSGLFAFTTATWRNQERNGGDFLEDGSDSFWLLDAGIGYRLPRRHGIVQLKLLNLLDQDFEYDQSLGFEEFVRPDIGAALSATVNF